jgi:hypothetical protein
MGQSQSAHHSALPTFNPAPIPMTNMAPPGTPTHAAAPAWKSLGYKDFGKWMALDDDFFVFRRFESLNAETILWMQYKISVLERALEHIHKDVETSASSSMEDLTNSSFALDEDYLPARSKIMAELSGLLLQYSKHVVVGSRSRADVEQINS